MMLFIVVLVLIGLAVFAGLLNASKQQGARFQIKKALLSEPEQILYGRLVRALPEFHILAQVAFSQIIFVAGGDGKENFQKNATAKQKVADYVVCDKRFGIMAIIELDDSSHNRARDAKRDAIFEEAGTSLVRWNVRNIPSEEQIMDELPRKVRNSSK
jgi:hypothetical protein